MTPHTTYLQRVAFWLLVALVVVTCVFPFYYAVLTSFKSGSALFEVDYLPHHLDLSNYRAVFRDQPFGRNILNSLLVAGSVVTLSLVLSLAAAFALSRVAFRGRRLLLASVLSVSMFPQVAVLAGLFELVRALGLYDRLGSLVLSNLMLTLPFTVWVLTTYMRELPRELEEAAYVDGASAWTVLWRIFLPLMWPALMATGLLAFIAAWNEFLFALTFVISDGQRTVPVAIALLTGGSQHELPWGRVMAASVIVTLPLIALVLLLQRRIVSGLAAGAVKG